MDSNQTLESLRRCKDALTEQFGVSSLALFGSAARGDSTQTSDVDVLISFNGEEFALAEEEEHAAGVAVSFVSPFQSGKNGHCAPVYRLSLRPRPSP